MTDPVIWDGDPDCNHEWGDNLPPHHPGQVEQTKWKDAKAAGHGQTAASGKFCQKCGAWCGELGLEPTPELYVKHLVDISREIRRVLRQDGIFWINLGDSYSNWTSINKEGGAGFKDGNYGGRIGQYYRTSPGLKQKDLIGIPWLVAFALRADGWWLRSDIIVAKRNCMPSSVKDRCTSSHEYIFMLTKSQKYFYDADAIREPHNQNSIKRLKRGHHRTGHKWETGPGDQTISNDMTKALHPSGRNKRDVWWITIKGFKGAHFAVFPSSIPLTCILAGTSEKGCCPKCGAPYKRVVEKGETDEEWKRACGADTEGEYKGQSKKWLKQNELGKATYTGFNKRWKAKQQNASDVKRRILAGMVKKQTVNWEPTCTCNAGDPIPCTVLDPFLGSGTTSMVARDLNRSSIGIELNKEYIEIIKKRLNVNECLNGIAVDYIFKEL
jgi:DNA modification methylase